MAWLCGLVLFATYDADISFVTICQTSRNQSILQVTYASSCLSLQLMIGNLDFYTAVRDNTTGVVWVAVQAEGGVSPVQVWCPIGIPSDEYLFFLQHGCTNFSFAVFCPTCACTRRFNPIPSPMALLRSSAQPTRALRGLPLHPSKFWSPSLTPQRSSPAWAMVSSFAMWVG